MSDGTTAPGQTPAGWYPVDNMHERFWDGNGWTDQVRPTAAAGSPHRTEPVASHGNPSDAGAPSPSSGAGGGAGSKPAWYGRGWVIGVGALLVGFTLGSAGASEADPKSTAEYQAVAADQVETAEQLDDAETDLAAAEQELSAAKADLESIAGDLPAREDAVAEAEAALEEREATVAKAEKAVVRREKAVGVVEKEITKNTISGEGIYEAGVDIKPGTYKTSGAPGCYYAVLNSLDGFDIANNNNIDGPGILNISAGQFLEVSRCADWVLQR